MGPPSNSGEAQQSQEIDQTARQSLSNGSTQQGERKTPDPNTLKNKARALDSSQTSPSAEVAPKDAKPSGKEMKESKKAEKAARRAKEKGALAPQPIAQPERDRRGESKSTTARRNSNTQAQSLQGPKVQHKRSGSSGTKNLPLRQAEPNAASKRNESKRGGEKNVALFDHLYGHPKRTTIAGAGKDVHPAVLALGLQMSSYVICGSNARCVAMLLVFQQVIRDYKTPLGNSLPRHLTTHLASQIDYLVSCRPISVSMGNAIRWLKVEISEVDISTPESSAKADLCSGIETFVRERVTVAGQVIAANAAEKIENGDVVLTYGKSSTVQQTLIHAVKQGKRFRVIVVDSRPLFEGQNFARALVGLGLEVQYSLLHGLSHVIDSVSKVYLGAHAMMSNGRLYSRVGTALVAMTAKEFDIPVIICCESLKFTDRVALDSFVHNEIAPPDELLIEDGWELSLQGWRDVPNLQLLNLMYDLTPAEYIKMVITEYGSLPPSSVPVVHRLSTDT